MARYSGLKLPTQSLRVQMSNKALWNEERSTETADFYTLGYMGRDIDEFVSLVKSARVSTVIDIRHAAVSMYKPAFSKRNLQQYLERNGVHYLHLPSLGVPRDIRGRAIETGSRDDIWEWYDSYVVERFVGRNLNDFFNAADHPIALMCVELDPTACHRHRLFLALERNGLRGFDI